MFLKRCKISANRVQRACSILRCSLISLPISLKSAAKVQQKYEMREVKSEKFADFNDFLSQTP